jgi:beta-1,4-N-acetylglucosaminyltransferase
LTRHAGSGTILEGLSLGKRMIVVVNDKLMDNHQMEIASVMGQVRSGGLHSCENVIISACVRACVR